MNDLFGVPISPAAVCGPPGETADALAPVAAEALAHVAGKPANVDETGWREGGKRAWLWVAVTAAVTAFLVRLSRARKVLADLIPGDPGTPDDRPLPGLRPPAGRRAPRSAGRTSAGTSRP